MLRMNLDLNTPLEIVKTYFKYGGNVVYSIVKRMKKNTLLVFLGRVFYLANFIVAGDASSTKLLSVVIFQDRTRIK